MIGFQFWDIKVKLIHNINFIGLQKPYWSVTKNWKYHKIAFSLNKVFPGSATRYCYFHYTQSLKRQLSEKGVQAREETNLAIGQFRYLYTAARLSAYVPPQDVRQWFEQVKKYTWNKGSPPEKKKVFFLSSSFLSGSFFSPSSSFLTQSSWSVQLSLSSSLWIGGLSLFSIGDIPILIVPWIDKLLILFCIYIG